MTAMIYSVPKCSWNPSKTASKAVPPRYVQRFINNVCLKIRNDGRQKDDYLSDYCIIQNEGEPSSRNILRMQGCNLTRLLSPPSQDIKSWFCVRKEYLKPRILSNSGKKLLCSLLPRPPHFSCSHPRVKGCCPPSTPGESLTNAPLPPGRQRQPPQLQEELQQEKQTSTFSDTEGHLRLRMNASLEKYFHFWK